MNLPGERWCANRRSSRHPGPDHAPTGCMVVRELAVAPQPWPGTGTSRMHGGARTGGRPATLARIMNQRGGRPCVRGGHLPQPGCPVMRPMRRNGGSPTRWDVRMSGGAAARWATRRLRDVRRSDDLVVSDEMGTGPTQSVSCAAGSFLERHD